jgi:murein L,D-transpeptidase YcbB/YkuD
MGTRRSGFSLDTVFGLDDGEFVFDVFGEPETAETVERGWQRPRVQSLRGRSGEDGRGRRPPTGVVGIGRLAGLVAVVIAAVVALVTGLGACQGARDDYASYLRQVRTLAQSSSRTGAELATDLRSSALTRAVLARRLQDLAAQEQQAYDQAQQIRPPGPLRQVHGELLAALELRATGLAGLAQSLATTAPGSAADALAAQARLLTTSDVIWNELYRMPVAQQLRIHRVIGLVVPHSRFVSNTDLVAAPAFVRLLQRLHNATSGRPAPLLKPGVSGAAVKIWQRLLNRWLRTQPGQPPLPIDGTFGALTATATKALQQAAGITADGIVGQATRQALAHQLAHIK